MGISVYLAGKIYKNCWRHEFVNGLRDTVPKPREEWPVLINAIAPGVDYCGPYFASCDHGCNHQPQSHGVIHGECYGSYVSQLREDHSGESAWDAKRYVFDQCWDAIQKCDVLIAVIDHDTYGTLVEIGWAYALKKQIIIVSQNEVHEDLWFSQQTAYHSSGDVNDAIRVVRRKAEILHLSSLCESPMETLFFDECIRRRINFLVPAVKAGPYRLDFADPENKIAVEIDGFDYHSSKEHIVNDRKRQRDLEMMGWRIIRFAGSEVHRDVAKCVNDFIQIRRTHLQS